MPTPNRAVQRWAFVLFAAALALGALALAPVEAQVDSVETPAGETISGSSPSQSVDWVWPVPRPGVRPISGTVPYVWPYPYPYWCTFPTPVAPPLPPGFPSPVPPTPVPSPTPGGPATAATYTVCPQIQSRVPNAVLQAALAEPWTVYGFNQLKNPGVPYHPMWNVLRTELNLLNPNVPYSVCNPVVWKAGCW